MEAKYKEKLQIGGTFTVVVYLLSPPRGIEKRGSDGFFCLLGQNRRISWAQQKSSDGYTPFNSAGGGESKYTTTVNCAKH